jgi:class 3 adenylate cyclase
MERDEDRTLARLKAHGREFIEPLIAEYQGRIVKLMGDGALFEFANVVDAVRCAILIQQGMAEREAAVPEAERIRLRIGINLGDVIREADGDLCRLRNRLRPPPGQARPAARVRGRAAHQEHRAAGSGLPRPARQ